MFHNRRWAVVPMEDITEEMIKDSIETDFQNLRKSIDGTKAILKWEEDEPAWVSSMGLTVLNLTGFMTTLHREEWLLMKPRTPE